MRGSAVLATVLLAWAFGGCGGDSGAGGTSTSISTPSPTATARDDYYAAMNDLATRLDRAVAAALADEADAVQRITGVVRDVRAQLRKRRAAGGRDSPGGNLLLTTAMSARDYARNGDRQGLQLIRDVPLVEARDALTSEAGGG